MKRPRVADDWNAFKVLHDNSVTSPKEVACFSEGARETKLKSVREKGTLGSGRPHD